MSRKLKERIEGELQSRYEPLEGALVVDMSKLTGVQANAMRGRLRSKGIELHVVKNRLARRVLKSSKLEPLNPALAGPCAVVTSKSSLIEVAKELVDLLKEYPEIVLKGGVVDGEPDFLPIEQVAKRRTRLEIIGDALAAAVAPGRRLTGALRSPGAKLAGCVKAIAEKLEKGETLQKVA